MSIIWTGFLIGIGLLIAYVAIHVVVVIILFTCALIGKIWDEIT